ncbi:HNH endonuclease signature motif containing protein [Stigmatella sp. ncwal1]|uniref:HNH endonuclease signature motif containing protein n=1 Tax=Stigmatella ashevillensis TaxID=2995309 RepID=A0ABT5DFM2_9BACT|nr:HNH endonuclease signature motif containing protein [Stigmatella ashevillena]MDC0712466.1 HNH endonuclease signature motif containing protein [Stigmatella ashevillena]
MEHQRAWLALSLGAEREYAGNEGYADELDTVYRYDSFVPNHRRVAEGDLLVLCNRKVVLRVAQINKIHSRESSKELRRCPECHIATIKGRKAKRPMFRCKAGHVFDTPKVTSEDCTQYEAHFEGASRTVLGNLSVQEVRRACPDFNGQLAIQKLELALLTDKARSLLRSGPVVDSVPQAPLLLAQDALDAAYVPDGQDERERIERQIRARRGQKEFRQALRKRFDDTCLVTRCRLPDLLEAAHISPYRGDKDNHPSNGLLLRADIHTLFDLDLLGIEPTTLKVHLHPKLRGMGYDAVEGTVLAGNAEGLSREALESRWRRFASKTPQ